MEKRICSKCDLYSFPLRRCKRGQINPKTKKAALKAASLMGSHYICDYSKWKEAVVAHYGRDYHGLL